MVVFNHGGRFQGPPGRFFLHHNWWWGFWAHFITFLFFLALIALVVWVVVRLTRPQMATMVPVGTGMRPPPHRDPALEEVRLRYARGEMTREEFVQRSRDLGGVPEPQGTRPEPPEPEPGDAAAEAGEPEPNEGG
jgi:putative membrane protein